ncbi:MAG: hypothetical protein KC636_12810, partial [Myxococcales bacterium]|nr:hypothetical protein [Myxococcales bacterium]
MSEAWLGDVRAALERRIAAAGAAPDFLDVVARAHELDPEAMPAERVEEADALAAQASEALDRSTAEQEARLDDWLGDVRAAVERRVDDQRSQPRPSLPVHRDRRATWWVGGVALAAAVLLVLGVGQVVRVLAEQPEAAPDQALRVHEPSDATGTAEARPSPSRGEQGVHMQRPEPVEYEAVVVPEAAPETETETE